MGMGGDRGWEGAMWLPWLQPWCVKLQYDAGLEHRRLSPSNHGRSAMVGGMQSCKSILSQGWWDDNAILV